MNGADMTEEQIYANEIIQRIKSRRKELGLSYQQLANRTGIHKSSLQRYETGFISSILLKYLRRLADGLETTPQYILGLEIKKEGNYEKENNA